MCRTAILISGSGSNLQALIDASKAGTIDIRIALVLSNNPSAFGLERARKAGIETSVIDHRRFERREDFDQAISAELSRRGIELVCLAGFMRILGSRIVEQWKDRMINIHPSLLPAFKGLNTHTRALDAGVKVHGCTVHLVTPELDDGRIIAQGVVPVLEDDTPSSLAARVLEVEHRCYPLAVGLHVGSIAGSPLAAHPLIVKFTKI